MQLRKEQGMETTRLLATAMAEQCRGAIEASGEEQHLELPDALRASHLRWMCLQIESHVEHWHLTRIHRWIGFIQAGMLANGMLSDTAASGRGGGGGGAGGGGPGGRGAGRGGGRGPI